MVDMHLTLLLVATAKSSGDCKTSIIRPKVGQKKVDKLETLKLKEWHDSEFPSFCLFVFLYLSFFSLSLSLSLMLQTWN